jgi:aminoglycoside N3'-acetyltransferase
MKTFEGVICRDGLERRESCTYNVRYLDKDVETHLARFEKRLLDKGVLQSAPLGSGAIEAVPARALFDEGVIALNENIYSFLDHPARI